MTKRVFAIDAVRGWVMIFMALDHAMYFSYVHIFAEGFQGMRPDPLPDAAHYMTRFVTHYCAPTFIFLAGFSVILYTWSHKEQLTESQITQKLVTRGILLIVLQMIVVNPIWGIGLFSGLTPIYFGILSCIGAGLIVLAFARRLPLSVLAGSSVLLLLLMPLLLKTFTLTDTDQLLEIVLQPDVEGWLAVRYPILPWLTVLGLGCACGLYTRANPERFTKFFLVLGVILLVGWLLVRLGGGYGNLTPYQGGDWRDFMLMSKYPPSLVFLLWNLGGMSIAIAGHDYLEKKVNINQSWNVITLFGQTPLFFYVVHLVVYRGLSFVLWGNTLGTGYLAWVVGLVVMVPLCYGYRSLKRKYPDSILQYI